MAATPLQGMCVIFGSHPSRLPRGRAGREGGREEESRVTAQTTPAKPWGLSSAMQGGKSQQPAGHLHPAATRPPAPQSASLGSRG